MNLTQNQRAQILSAVRKRVLKNHFNVAGIDYSVWAAAFDARREELMKTGIAEFEAGIQELLEQLRSSHTRLFHEKPSRLLPQHTINATLGSYSDAGKPLWYLMDVFEDGPAAKAGLRRGDILHSVNGVSYAPPEVPRLEAGTHSFSVSAPDGSDARDVSIIVPSRKTNKNLPPILPPKTISTSIVEPGAGLLRITWFPGAMGLAFAKELDKAIAELKREGCDRLIIDLRGNIGGGLGFARLASYLCPDRVPIGYSVTPGRQRKGYREEELEHVVYPSSRLGFAVALSRFAVRDKSIYLLTQGLGIQPFHGKTVILVNEWTNSAAEMVASFASENKLATIVGTKTAGNVLGSVNVKVGAGYWLQLPVFGWHTSKGICQEGSGVEPDIPADVSPVELNSGVDHQLDVALQVLRGLGSGAKRQFAAV